MKRSLKNIISSILIIIFLISIFLTMNYIKNNNSTSNNNMPSMNNNGNNMTPPGNESGNNNGTPPNMPNSGTSENNDNSKTPPSMPNGNSENMNEPPEKPNGEDNGNTNSNENNTDTAKEENEQQKNNSETNNQNTTGENQDNRPSMPNNMENNSTKLETKYYIIFGIESLLLGATITYMILSNLNKKGIKETFKNKDKVIIFIMSTIILTASLTYVDSFITKKYFISNSENDIKNMNNGSTNVTYTASKEINESTTIDSGDYNSTESDENAILINNGTSTISNINVTKTGDSDSGDATSFYGNNSAILVKDGATVTLKNITVETNAKGANGVFSYGGSATTNNSNSDGTTVNISDSKIKTTKDNSGGIMTTGGGIMNATNLDIETSGTSSAAIRTDRGGGTVNVNKGSYKTTGQGSPTIYSTANITVKNATLTSTTSEGVVIEGKNSVTLENVTLTDTNNKLNGQSTTYKNIFLYQSMSGDASEGTSTFTSQNSKITTNKGDTFYITNTTATINLENNEIVNNDETGNFLRAQKDSWGTTNSNGGIVTLNMKNQKAYGNIEIDSISTLDMTLNKKSYYEGTINNSNTAKSITLKLDKTSSIKLTGDSYVTSLENEDTKNSNINFNGYKLYVNGVAIN